MNSPRWMLIALAATAAAAAAGYEPYPVFEDRWREFALSVKDLSREERRQRSVEYLERISWDQVLHYCRRSEEPDRPLAQSLNGLVDTRLRLGLAEVGPLLELLAEPQYCTPCQKAVVKFLSIHRDSVLALPESRDYGRALLRLADSGRRGPDVVKQLEQAAAGLCDDEALMDRMMDYSRSEDSYRVFQAVQMLGGSRDARAPDSLMAVARRLKDRPEHRRALSRAVSVLGVQPGAAEKCFDFFLSLYRLGEGDLTGGLARDALMAMASSGSPRFYPVLLGEYDDTGTGIVDATGAIEDPDRRRRYWNLWFLTRLAEPGMIPLFEHGAPEAVEALELLDRASRFGLPAERERLLEPLAAWAGRQPAPRRERALKIIHRFRSYDDPRVSP